MRSQGRGRGILSNTRAIEDYEWDYGQVQSSALPRTQPSLDLSQTLPNQYTDQNENNYTLTRPATSTSIEGIAQGIAHVNLGSTSSSVQQPTSRPPWTPPSNYIKTRDLSTDREAFDPRECRAARPRFGGHCPDIW